MKKIVKLTMAVALLIAGSQLVSAQSLSQDQNRPEVVAKAEVAQMDKALNLDENQERALFRAITGRIVNYRKLVDGKDLSNAENMANKKKIDAGYDAAVKKAIGEKKYKMWLAMQE